jgi:hypothetical protein
VPYAALDVRGRTDVVAVVTPSVSLPGVVRATATPAAMKVCVTGHIYNVAGGTPLRNWILQLTGPDGSTRSARSFYNGLYGFNDLPPGTYTLSIQGQSGWRIVSPPSSVIDVAPSKTCLEVDFWNERSQDSSGSNDSPAVPTPER